MRRIEDIGQDPSRRRPGRLRQPRREIEHARAEVDPDDFVGSQIPERQGVATTRALEVDRAPAPAVEVADELDLDAEQVDAARADQPDGFVEPALVSLRRLVPGRTVRRMHGPHVGEFHGGRPADKLPVISHAGSVASDDRRRLPLKDDDRDHRPDTGLTVA